MLKELRKELLGQEFMLLELDNKIREMLNLEDSRESIFEGETDIYVYQNKSYSYYLDDETEIDVRFTIVEDNNCIEDVIVRVTEIELI